MQEPIVRSAARYTNGRNAQGVVFAKSQDVLFATIMAALLLEQRQEVKSMRRPSQYRFAVLNFL